MRSHRKTRKRAKELRRPMTRAEVILWTRLQKRQVQGLHFRRQHPVAPYIPDFSCVKARLIVEVDGATHSTEDERGHDERRRQYLEEQGWTILRVWNDEIYRNENGVVETMMDWARAGITSRAIRPPAAVGPLRQAR
jgi:very-short-patch-repair endonuclease